MSDPKRFDVICVGCGPAGNLAAYTLARAGAHVLLVDGQTLPRTKPCGGGLSAKALRLLPYDISTVTHHAMHGADIRLHGGASTTLASGAIGAMVERAEFDHFMAERAVDAGATLVTGATVERLADEGKAVTIGTSAGDFTGTLLIGADGANSTVRRLLFPAFRPSMAFAIEAKVSMSRGVDAGAVPPEKWTNALLDFGAARHGYGWIFPKRDHFNVGIYRLWKSPSDLGLGGLLDEFVARQGVLNGLSRGRPLGHPIPLCDAEQPVHKGRSILIGDAAGLGEAFFGEGISYALKSAIIAAQWAGDSLDGRSRSNDFEGALKPLRRELQRSLHAARVLYSMPQAWLGRLAASPGLLDLAAGYLRGEPSHFGLLCRLPHRTAAALLRLPLAAPPTS